MRELTTSEMALICGGTSYPLPGITVTASRVWAIGFFSGGSFYGGGANTDQKPPPELPPLDCNAVNNIYGTQAPDGATYYLPEGVTREYLLAAIAHLQSFDRITQHDQLLSEFYNMYTDPNHPHFIDFKDWGTENGPPGSQSGGLTRYWSDTVGDYVVSSPFEAFGNFFYGFAGRAAGITETELLWAAGYTQTGASWNDKFFFGDGPQDQPHVRAGMDAATNFMLYNTPTFGIMIGNCATGTTASGMV